MGCPHYGSQHFRDVFQPELWAVIFVYAFIIVIVAPLVWYRFLPGENTMFVVVLVLVAPVAPSLEPGCSLARPK